MHNGKVWHVISNRWNSAVTEYALSAAKALRSAGFGSVISCLEASPCHKRAVKSGFDVEPFLNLNIKGLKRLFGTFRRSQPDWVITYGGAETFFMKFLPLKTTPLVRFRGEDRDMKRSLTSLSLSLSHSHARGFLTPNEILARKFEALTNKPVRHVVLGCDEYSFYFDGSAPTSAKRDEILMVGRLDPVKGHSDIFLIYQEAFSAESERPLLHIVGEPANLGVSDIEARARAAGLEAKDYKITPTRVGNLRELMQNAALGAIPSLDSEVICRVGEEFLLCGTPILVSGAGALNEIIRPEGFGWSYKGLSHKEAGGLLRSAYKAAAGETNSERKTRAVAASSYYSLNTMAENLTTFMLSIRS